MFLEPIKWCEDHVLVLDQRQLPWKTEWIAVRSADEMAALIRSMAVRGAPLIGIAAAYAVAVESLYFTASAPQELHYKHVKNSINQLKTARPTAANLAWALSRMSNQAKKSFEENQPLFQTLLALARQIHEEDQESCRRIASFGIQVLPAGAVLTHCNTGALATGGMGTAYGVIKEGFHAGKVSHVFACESRPYLQGARLTCYELVQDKIPFTLITDSMAGYYMFTRRINAVIVGADRVAVNGDLANKVGTYGLAVLAHENKIPFYVALPVSTIDPALQTGVQIPIEERRGCEVTQIMGINIAPEGTTAGHPAFDITPAKFISGFITDQGIAAPPFQESLQGIIRKGTNVAAV